jgi:3-methylfumaryl-CoA hydratase
VDASCKGTTVDPERVRGLQQLMLPDHEPLAIGDPLPPLWHWVALPRWFDPMITGPDGHPQRPGPLRDVTAVRRMFAGGEVAFSDVRLLVGDEVFTSTEVTAVTRKTGRSGSFVLATFTTRIRNVAGEELVRERQDVVYMDPRPTSASDAPTGSAPIVGRPLVSGPDGVQLHTDPTVLMRFSALTANSHRIHYDLDYARDVEQLPGLLVHGPLINLALMHVATSQFPGAPVRRVNHRNLGPLFCGQTSALAAKETGAGVIESEATGPGQNDTVLSRLTVELDLTTERTPS